MIMHFDEEQALLIIDSYILLNRVLPKKTQTII